MMAKEAGALAKVLVNYRLHWVYERYFRTCYLQHRCQRQICSFATPLASIDTEQRREERQWKKS